MTKRDSERQKIRMEEKLESLFDIVENSTELPEDEISPLVQELKEISQRYIQPELIAHGGMKTITKVFDRKTGRFIAMAKLHKEAPQELYEPFLREARLTALLDHPNIISIYDIGLDENSAPFFTMELKTGQNLHDLLAKRHKNYKIWQTVELNQFLEMFLKICDGISYSHSQQVLHLDLKPANIQVGLYGEVIICDWGLGKVMGHLDYDGGEFDSMLLNPDLLNNMTKVGEFRGTPGFMAPEQLNSDEKVTTKTDIYALGAILYTILTGKPPINTDENLDKVLNNTAQGLIISPNELVPNHQIHLSLSAVTMKALNTDQKNRYQNIEGLRHDVHNFITGYSTSAENAGFVTEFHLFFKRNQIVCLIILLFMGFIGSLTFYFVQNLSRSKNEAELSQKTAIVEKKRAERILTLYKAQKASLSVFVEENFSTLKNEVYNFTDAKIFNNPEKWCEKSLSYLNKMIESESADLWPYMQRGYVYFLMQNFKHANADFTKYCVKAESLYKVTQRDERHSKNGQLLPPDILIQVIKDLSNEGGRFVQVVIMTLYDGAKRDSLSDHSRIVEATLKAYNHQWTMGLFDYNEEKSSLRISGKGLNKLLASAKDFSLEKKPGDIKIPLLQTLKLKFLDLRNSEIYCLKELTGLKIKELDISDTLINSGQNIKRYLPNLKKLTVNLGQFKKNDPVWSNSQIELIIK